MSEVPPDPQSPNYTRLGLRPDDVSQEKSSRYREMEPSSGSNLIPRRARPGLADLRPHTRAVHRSKIDLEREKTPPTRVAVKVNQWVRKAWN